MTVSSHARPYGPRNLPGAPDYINPNEGPEEFGRRVAQEAFEKFYAPIFDELERQLNERRAEQDSQELADGVDG